MSLTLDITVPERDVDVHLEVARGQTLALVGPNGAGKSTVLAACAGLLQPDSGEIRLDDRILYSSRADVFVPPHDRRVGLLAQDSLLFPRLTVLDNVAFGPRSTGRSRNEARADAGKWLDQVDATELAGRRPGELSGGQAQRVAIARALATRPELLLLDEPLAALDVDVATLVRQMLRRVLAGQTAILVTHEILDAVLLADRTAVVEAGRIVAEGPTETIIRQPRSSFAAGLFGWNMLMGSAAGPQSVRTDSGWMVHGQADPPLPAGQDALAVFRPGAVSVYRTVPQGSPRNVISGAVTALEPHGHLIRVRVGEVAADVTAAAVADLDLTVGEDVHLTVKAAETWLYPA